MDIAPTFKGYIEDENDALLVLQATLDGRLKHIPRRPYEVERRCLITSGSVFVFIEELSGIKRWTDGVSWSPSRISGKFLMYKELDKSGQYPSIGPSRKRPVVMARMTSPSKPSSCSPPSSGSSSLTSSPSLSPRLKLSSSGNDEPGMGGDRRAATPASSTSTVTTFSSPYQNFSSSHHERSGQQHHASKYTGFVKKTMSVKIKVRNTMSLETLHIVSYYAIDDVHSGKLIRPKNSTFFGNTKPSKELLIAMENTSLGSHSKSGSTAALMAASSPISLDNTHASGRMEVIDTDDNNTAGSIIKSSQRKNSSENNIVRQYQTSRPSVPNMQPLPCLRIPPLVSGTNNNNSTNSNNHQGEGGLSIYPKFARISENPWPNPYFNNNSNHNNNNSHQGFQSPSNVTRSALSVSARSQPPPPMLSKLNARFYNFPSGYTQYGNSTPNTIDQKSYLFYSVPPAPLPSASFHLPPPLTGMATNRVPVAPPIAMTSIPNLQDGSLSKSNTTNTAPRRTPASGGSTK